MDCGHSIHRTCFNEYMTSSYKCPICNKSIVNMEALFTNLANIIRGQPMPEEFEHVKSIILCNDCSAKCTTQYHFLGLRCQICASYNTVELERSEMPGERAETQQAHVPGHSAPAIPTTPAHHHNPSHNHAIAPSSGSALHPSSSHVPYNSSQDAANRAGNHTHAVPEPESAMDDDEELDFWGGGPRSGPESEEDDDYEDDTDAEDSENEEDDDNEDEDIVLFGHR